MPIAKSPYRQQTPSNVRFEEVRRSWDREHIWDPEYRLPPDRVVTSSEECPENAIDENPLAPNRVTARDLLQQSGPAMVELSVPDLSSPNSYRYYPLTLVLKGSAVQERSECASEVFTLFLVTHTVKLPRSGLRGTLKGRSPGSQWSLVRYGSAMSLDAKIEQQRRICLRIWQRPSIDHDMARISRIYQAQR